MTFMLLLGFDHHSVRISVAKRKPLGVRVFASEACPHTLVIPPTSAKICGTVKATGWVVVVVFCREFHAVMVVAAKTATTEATFILERVSGVSTVSSQFQSIFVVELITDLE